MNLNVFKSILMLLLLLFGCSSSTKLMQKSEYHEITKEKVELGKKVNYSDTLIIDIPPIILKSPLERGRGCANPLPKERFSNSPLEKGKECVSLPKQSKSGSKSFTVEKAGKKAGVDIFYKTTIDSNKVITTIESLKVEFEEKKEVVKTTEKSEIKKQSAFWRTTAYFIGGICLAVVGLYLLRIFLKR